MYSPEDGHFKPVWHTGDGNQAGILCPFPPSLLSALLVLVILSFFWKAVEAIKSLQ